MVELLPPDPVVCQFNLQVAGVREQVAGEQILLIVCPLGPGLEIIVRQEDVVNSDQYP